MFSIKCWKSDKYVTLHPRAWKAASLTLYLTDVGM